MFYSSLNVHRSRARLCKSRSPDLDLFVIRRSQTTDGETHIVTMEFAGDRPPRYDKTIKNASPSRRARACPSPSSCTPTLAGDRPPRYGEKKRFLNHRGGNPLGCASGIRGPPRYGNIEPRGLSYRRESRPGGLLHRDREVSSQ